MRRLVATVGAAALVLTACGGTDDTTAAPTIIAAPTTADGVTMTDAEAEPASGAAADSTAAEELHPDVVGAEASRSADGTWRFDVTLSSPYDTPARYADAWRVLAPDGTVLGVRELAHDHQNEQPFTRSLGGVEIPDDVDVVTIEGRDQISSWGGETLELTLPR
ncbi:MAG: hypothetical protein AAGE98_14365 [Actinomycetota bacterium]